MTWLRHASRHIQETVANHVGAQLTALSWMDPDNTPFGAPVLTIVTQPIVSGDGLAKGVTAGTVACTLGTELDPELLELGGPLTEQEIPVFFDIFMAKAGEAMAVANDIRDILLARLAGTSRTIAVVDQASGAAVTGWRIEFEDVERSTPDQRLALHWQIVKVTASVTFPEVLVPPEPEPEELDVPSFALGESVTDGLGLAAGGVVVPVEDAAEAFAIIQGLTDGSDYMLTPTTDVGTALGALVTIISNDGSTFPSTFPPGSPGILAVITFADGVATFDISAIEGYLSLLEGFGVVAEIVEFGLVWTPSTVSLPLTLTEASLLRSAALGEEIVDEVSDLRFNLIPASGHYVVDPEGTDCFVLLPLEDGGLYEVTYLGDPGAAPIFAGVLYVVSNDESTLPLSLVPVGSVLPANIDGLLGFPVMGDLSGTIATYAGAGIVLQEIGLAVKFNPGSDPFTITIEGA